MNPNERFTALIEADLPSLLDLQGSLSSPFLLAYSRTITLYLQADVSALSKFLEQTVATPCEDPQYPQAARFLSIAGMLRLQIRKRAVTETLLSDAMTFAEEAPLFRGELLFLSALAWETLGSEEDCQELNRRASAEFEAIGALKKSVKALHNYVAAESRLHPERKLLAEYHALYRKAKLHREMAVAGHALNNIAREYQLLGAHSAALKTIQKALRFHGKEVGSIHYYLTLLNRAHIFLELDRLSEAEEDIALASAGEFSEVKSAVQVATLLLKRKKGESVETLSVDPKNILFTWRERLEQKNSALEPLTPMEEKVIDFLSKAPRDKYALMEALYGSRLDPEAGENRIRNLISRLRKKRPGLVVREDDLYKLSEPMFHEFGRSA